MRRLRDLGETTLLILAGSIMFSVARIFDTLRHWRRHAGRKH